MSPSERAAALLDDARAALFGLRDTPPPGIAQWLVERIADDAVRRLEWSGSWLDTPYAPAPRSASHAGGPGERRLEKLADRLEALIEEFEDDDPVRNANGVQTGSLAFAVVGATASYLRRLSAAATRVAASPDRQPG